MKLKATVGLLGLMIIALACSEGSSVVTGPTVFEIDPVFSMTAAAAGGSCPDLFYETTVTLPNGASVTWTSSFGGFDYAVGTDYAAATVTWSVSGGSATFDRFGARTNKKNTWTPRGNDFVDGTLTLGALDSGNLPIIVNMAPMHRGDEDTDGDGTPDWRGLIGNGHFWLVLDVDDEVGEIVHAKLGVNMHLEDPDSGFPTRCP